MIGTIGPLRWLLLKGDAYSHISWKLLRTWGRLYEWQYGSKLVKTFAMYVHWSDLIREHNAFAKDQSYGDMMYVQSACKVWGIDVCTKDRYIGVSDLVTRVCITGYQVIRVIRIFTITE